MSLTKQDLSDVRSVIIEAIDTMVSPRFDVLEQDVAELKGDVAILKADVAELKADVVVLKADVAVLKADVAVLKSDVSELKSDMGQVKHSLHNLDGRVEALENDIKEIYLMLADLQKGNDAEKQFKKLSLEKQLLKTYKEVLLVAKEAGIDLSK